MSKNGVKKISMRKIKPKDLVQEQKITGRFSMSWTNQRKHQISFRNGQFLNMDSNGNVYGSPVTMANKNKNNSKYFNLILGRNSFNKYLKIPGKFIITVM